MTSDTLQRIRAESTSVEISPYSPTTDSRLIRHHTSASSCTCTYTATPHVHVQAYLHIYMYKLTCTCTHILRAMRSTWKSPLPNMIRVHFRSGLLWVMGPQTLQRPSRPKRRLIRPSGTSPLLSKQQSCRLRPQYARLNALPHWIPRSAGTAPTHLQTSQTTPRGPAEEVPRKKTCLERKKRSNETRAGQYSNHAYRDLYRKRTISASNLPQMLGIPSLSSQSSSRTSICNGTTS